MLCGFDKLNTIGFEALGEKFSMVVSTLYERFYYTFSSAFEESGLYGVCKTVGCRLLAICNQSIYEQKQPLFRKGIGYAYCFPMLKQARKTLSLPNLQLLLKRCSFAQSHGREKHQLRSGRKPHHVVHDIANGMPFDFCSAHGRVRVTHARVQ